MKLYTLEHSIQIRVKMVKEFDKDTLQHVPINGGMFFGKCDHRMCAHHTVGEEKSGKGNR